MDYGRETATFFEIDQPLCTHSYGDAAGSPPGGCHAILGTTGQRRCYNTRATCQDPANYLPTFNSGQTPNLLTLRFSYPQEGLQSYGPLIPSLISVETAPASINLGAMDVNLAALGGREVVTIKIQDHKHSDLLVDPYRLLRNLPDGSPQIAEMFDPYERGTFWGKWIARNPYHSAYRCRVYQGFLGQDVGDMDMRIYVLDSISGPTDGTVEIKLKDLFSIIEARKAVAPTASRGELFADITSAASSATLSPTGIGDTDYPMIGSPSLLYVKIGDEIMAGTRSGDTLTFTQRGALGTTAAAHSVQDAVQWVLYYVPQAPAGILYDLLLNYATLTDSELPKSDWDVQLSGMSALYGAYIAEPTAVNDLVGELSQQVGFTLWANVKTGDISMTALRSTAPIASFDDSNIVDGTLQISRQDASRASEVWVYYGQIDPTKALDEKTNYHSRVVVVDTDAESDNQYAAPAIREVFSRWIQQFGRSAAQEIGTRILAMFRDPPLDATFSVVSTAADGLSLASYFSLEIEEVQDDTGAASSSAMAAIEIERTENRTILRGQEVTFTTPAAGGERIIYIENDVRDVNLRTLHDLLYATPVGGSPGDSVRFIVVNGVTVGATTVWNPAVVTGTWPTGVTLNMTVHGHIYGCGGDGAPGSSTGGGAGGNPGGTGISATAAITVDGDGVIAGGGGGGGGGGACLDAGSRVAGGGGAGGGQGDGGSNGGAGGTGVLGGGGGGTGGGQLGPGVGGGGRHSGLLLAGDGGTGGLLGEAGNSGSNATGGTVNGGGGTPGTAGVAISGSSFVTFAAGNTLTIKGALS